MDQVYTAKRARIASKEQMNEIVKAIIIIKPKSIIGLISVINNEQKATILVKVV